MLGKIRPPVNFAHNTKRKSRNPTTTKIDYVSSKNKINIIEVKNQVTSLDISIVLPVIDYNIVDVPKRIHANISIF